MAEQAGTAGPLGAGLASRIARSRGVETQLAGELLPPPVVATEEVPRAGAPAGKRAHRALLGAAAGLLAGLVVAALWVVAAVVTGLELAPLALVVGIAAGLVMRRLGERRRLSAALAGALVGLLAIALGLVMAAVAAYSHTEGAAAFTSFINAVALLDRSFLPHLWAETGVAGAAAAVAGVILAGLPVLIGRRTAS
ncbi:MAG TPA: hypothetical protein VEK76_11455 [Candidatus Binatia bacterium]|nr:hypothetical protein [Candidatus Binatia bacterium]